MTKEKIFKILKLTGKTLYFIGAVCLICIAIIVALTALNLPGGIKLYNVMSGSMEPSIKTGSVVVVKPSQKYVTGDVITFKDKEKPKYTVTHRVQEVLEHDGSFTYLTKGDANNARDSAQVDSDQVYGKVLLSVPYVGYPISFAKTQTGFIVLIVIPATLLVYGEIMNIQKEVQEMIKRKKLKAEENADQNKANN